MAVKQNGITPQLDRKYRMTDARRRVFEGIVRYADGGSLDVQVTASKNEFWKTIDQDPGAIVTIEAKDWSFEHIH